LDPVGNVVQLLRLALEDKINRELSCQDPYAARCPSLEA
jgi:hypothetical protein